MGAWRSKPCGLRLQGFGVAVVHDLQDYDNYARLLIQLHFCLQVVLASQKVQYIGRMSEAPRIIAKERHSWVPESSGLGCKP